MQRLVVMCLFAVILGNVDDERGKFFRCALELGENGLKCANLTKISFRLYSQRKVQCPISSIGNDHGTIFKYQAKIGTNTESHYFFHISRPRSVGNKG